MGGIDRCEHVRCGVRPEQSTGCRGDEPECGVVHTAGDARLRDDVLLADHSEGHRRIHGRSGVVVHDDRGASAATCRAEWSGARECRHGYRDIHVVDVGAISRREYLRCGVQPEQSTGNRRIGSECGVVHTAGSTRLRDDILLADHGEGDRRIHGGSGVVVHDNRGASATTRRAEWSGTHECCHGYRDIHVVDVGGSSRREDPTMWRSARAIHRQSSHRIRVRCRTHRRQHSPTRRRTTGRSRRRGPADPRRVRCGRSRPNRPRQIHRLRTRSSDCAS